MCVYVSASGDQDEDEGDKEFGFFLTLPHCSHSLSLSHSLSRSLAVDRNGTFFLFFLFFCPVGRTFPAQRLSSLSASLLPSLVGSYHHRHCSSSGGGSPGPRHVARRRKGTLSLTHSLSLTLLPSELLPASLLGRERAREREKCGSEAGVRPE